MKSRVALMMAAVVAVGAGFALAGPDDKSLVIDGKTLVTEADPPAGHPLDRLYSGWRFRNAETQAMEVDDFDNPSFVYVDIGQDLWSAADGAENKACADCHNDVSSMAGVRAAMPKWSEAAGKPWALENWINNCRTTRMGAKEWKWESQEMLSMTALVGLQSRGMPVNVAVDGPLQPWFERGKEIYYTRVGQLDLACANCHEDHWGQMIRADRLSQGQVNGFPLYRLKWQGIGSLHRRFKGCMEEVRADGYSPGSDELLALELYTAWRGTGLAIETPAVRQ